MQPTRLVSFSNPPRPILELIYRGMGGSRALLDCAETLPELRSLNDSAKSGGPVSSKQVEFALNCFKEKMVDRAIMLVARSGGTWVLMKMMSCALA